ncbi:MAG: sulfotransferase [Myxococcales bacterium]|nr:sulfotransferase [Myxococcales bacterium]MCB9714161.1 sulfotransferase [Myxococcales bacterium]
MSRMPDFIIIGAMKCATSTLHDQLAEQPGFVMSEPKEPNFFSDEENWAKGLGWYSGLFAAAEPGDLCGESSTHYSKLPRHPRVIERLQEHCPDAKFIYVMRHPIDRLVSHYIHEWTQRVLDVPISQALREHPALKDFSLYTMQLRPYFEAFGRQRVLPVFFDHLLRHSQDELERVCRFLAYGGKPRWKEDMGAKNVSAERLRVSPLRDLIVDFPPLAYLRRRFVPQQLRDRIKSLWTMRKRPELSADDRLRLAEVFDPDLAQLGQWLGMEELSCATFKERTRDRSWEWVSEPTQG